MGAWPIPVGAWPIHMGAWPKPMGGVAYIHKKAGVYP